MRNVILSVIAGAIISCLGTYYYIYRTVNDFNDFIYPGVSINGKEIPKITKEELENQLKEEYLKPVAAKTIIIRAEAKNYALSFSDLNPEYNINEISDEAYNYKKNENLLNKYFRITNLFSKGEKIELSLDYSFDDSAIIPLVDKIAADIYRDPVDATFKLENGTLIVTDDIKGAELNKDELIDELKEIAKDPNSY